MTRNSAQHSICHYTYPLTFLPTYNYTYPLIYQQCLSWSCRCREPCVYSSFNQRHGGIQTCTYVSENYRFMIYVCVCVVLGVVCTQRLKGATPTRRLRNNALRVLLVQQQCAFAYQPLLLILQLESLSHTYRIATIFTAVIVCGVTSTREAHQIPGVSDQTIYCR